MVLGMSPMLSIHVLLSIAGIATGFVVAWGLLRSARMPAVTAVFLATTVLTSVTGFLLPADKVLPSHIFGVMSLVALAVALYALYVAKLAGRWRGAYAFTALFALYLNTFVLVVQGFLKVPALKAIAPKGDEPPFAVAQGILLLAMLYLGWKVLKRFRPA